jgi:hypothetical protein
VNVRFLNLDSAIRGNKASHYKSSSILQCSMSPMQVLVADADARHINKTSR